MFGNNFRILNARMVQSVESVWTVLYLKYKTWCWRSLYNFILCVCSFKQNYELSHNKKVFVLLCQTAEFREESCRGTGKSEELFKTSNLLIFRFKLLCIKIIKLLPNILLTHTYTRVYCVPLVISASCKLWSHL